MWGRGWGVRMFRRGNGRSEGKAWEEREGTKCRPVREAMAGMPRSQAGGIELGPEGSGADGFQRASLAIGRWRGVHLTGLGTQREGAGAGRGGRSQVPGGGACRGVCGAAGMGRGVLCCGALGGGDQG